MSLQSKIVPQSVFIFCESILLLLHLKHEAIRAGEGKNEGGMMALNSLDPDMACVTFIHTLLVRTSHKPPTLKL